MRLQSYEEPLLIGEYRTYDVSCPQERDHSKDLRVDGRMILKWILGIELKGVDWTYLVHDKNRWWVLVHTVMKLPAP
jgi:hypothetical protein